MKWSLHTFLYATMANFVFLVQVTSLREGDFPGAVKRTLKILPRILINRAKLFCTFDLINLAFVPIKY